MRTVSLLIVVFAVGCTSDGSKLAGQMSWSYEGSNGPRSWGDNDGSELCDSGKAQSPIDITPAQKSERHLGFRYHASPLEVTRVSNNFVVPYGAGSYVTIGSDNYELKQFHFHSPSEHKIGGKAYPIAVHLVHENTRGGLAVVAVMGELGAPHETAERIFSTFGENAMAQTNVSLNAKEFLPESATYFAYEGSLTTPPCSEGVQWILMKEPIQFSKEQQSQFIAEIGENARPLQRLNKRVVSER